MNIFYLHSLPNIAAKYHCDKHVVSQIKECAQMLCTVHQIIDGKQPDLYRMTHQNHPCVKWILQGRRHYQWTYMLFTALCEEYTKRYDKVHLCEKKFKERLRIEPTYHNVTSYFFGFVQPPQCMPDDCKVPGDTVTAYRNYYIKHKSKFTKWKNVDTPPWFISFIP